MKKLTTEFKKSFAHPNLLKACEWLDENRKQWVGKYYFFEFPEYCGLPKKISYKLMSDEVDFLQETIPDSCYSKIDP